MYGSACMKFESGLNRIMGYAPRHDIQLSSNIRCCRAFQLPAIYDHVGNDKSSCRQQFRKGLHVVHEQTNTGRDLGVTW